MRICIYLKYCFTVQITESNQLSDLECCLEVSESCLREVFKSKKLSEFSVELSLHEGAKTYGYDILFHFQSNNFTCFCRLINVI
jgi:hypothetical protein